MAGLFSKAQRAQIDATAVKSEQPLKKTSVNHKSINNDLNRISQEVLEYFKDSPAILIHNIQELHDYISNMIDAKYGALDCETTGLDRINDNVVGFSLYYPGGVECYIPIKHIRPIVDELRPNQLTYEECRSELQRLVDNKVRLVFANADFDLAMMYKNFKVDLCPICYYDVILAWRCLKENEKSNKLKDLYHKYVLKGEGESKQFSDFFPVNLFPYCNPDIAKLYAANDAKITYELFLWQLPYVMKDNPKCKSKGLENIADLVWNIEMPLIKTCQMMHRNGVYLDKSISDRLNEKYDNEFNSEVEKLRGMVQDILDNPKYHSRAKRPFNSSIDFNYNSTKHVTYLLYSLMNLPTGKGGQSTDKEILRDFNLPITNQLLKVRSLSTLISTFVKKLPNATSSDSRIHCQFKQIGADTGRLSSADPNMQNIPSKSKDIRRMFRATPGYVMLSSDYSAQEPRITAYVSQDEKMIQSFKDGKDIYGSIASIAFEVPYEDCLEFHPVTGEYQPEGKARRGEAKTIVLGICYGRSVVTIADQLYGTNTEMTDDEKVKKAQYVYDSVLKAFPGLRTLMNGAENCARQKGYVETILGRRRHIPDMQLPEFEFVAMPGYVNPDIDPLNIDTLDNNEEIPKRIIYQLTKEFKSYKYYGQIVKRTKELKEDHIKVINNRYKIQEASRKCVNCVDFDTEILTCNGWKRYNEVEVGDDILSYSFTNHEIVMDKVNAVHIYNEKQEIIRFESPTFSAASTRNHRWVVGTSDEIPYIKFTENIYKNKWPDYPILRVANNSFEDNPDISDNILKLLGWVMTDGCIEKNRYGIHIYQSTKRHKNSDVYSDMINTLDELDIDITDNCRDGIYHEIYLKKCDITKWIYDTFPNRILSFNFVSTLSQHQSEVLMRAMLQGDGTGVDSKGYSLKNNRVSICCRNEMCRDVFQYLCYRAGYATNYYKIDMSDKDYTSNHILYDSMGNIPVSKSTYYDVTVLKIKRAQIYPKHKSIDNVDGVWCITSKEGTWIARRNGKVYITGNSIVQGSAAEQTKMAMLLIDNDPEWKRIGGRLLIPVHDELIAEVPMENWEEGAKILSNLMCKAADFLPFESKCDVEVTYRWYGLSYPCQYPQPHTMDNLSKDEIKWVQYHLFECGYELPKLKEHEDDELRGDAALGISGIVSDEYNNAISDYMNRYNIPNENIFIQHIHTKVNDGVILSPEDYNLSSN